MKKSVNHIKSPVLYCPFPSTINQHCEAAEQHTLNWVRSFNFVTDESAYQTLSAAKFHLMTARVYPNASLEALKIFNDFMLWGFFVDDQFEKFGIRKQPELLEPVHARLVEILKGAKLIDVDTPVTRAWQDILQRLYQLPHVTSEWKLRFTKNMDDYFQGVRQEAANNCQGIKLELATYIKLRSFSSGAYPFLDLYQIVNRIALAPEVIEHPIMKRLEMAANNVSCWSNDILGVEKDMREGGTYNLVVVLQQEYQIPLQEAVERAIELHNAEARTFIDLSPQLPSFGAEIDANFQCYLSGLRSWMRGCFDWYLESSRYRFTETTLSTAPINR